MAHPGEREPIVPTGNFTKEKFIKTLGEVKGDNARYTRILFAELSVSDFFGSPSIGKEDLRDNALSYSFGRVAVTRTQLGFDANILRIAAANEFVDKRDNLVKVIYPRFHGPDNTISGIVELKISDAQLSFLLSE